ncbi:MAG TPA: carbohydrate kinase [Candidatus Omnitrophota bacterium]|nr:carbohydrate kinase [Candidatus Omnitrophota bacterium]HPS19674.1 carbohydrate kinase [Candidatus Omnitrophota bacterium]
MKKLVLLAGNISFDLIKSVTHSDGLGFTAYIGGSICNTAIQVSRLGLPVALFSCLGKDPLSDYAIHLLKKEHILTKYIHRNGAFHPSLAIANLDKQGNSSYSFSRASASAKFEHIPKSFLKNISVFHTGSFFCCDISTYPIALSLVKKMKKAGVPSFFDPNWRASRIDDIAAAKKRIFSLLPYFSLVKLSDDDITGITGEADLNRAISILEKHTRAHIIVTLGEKGSLYKSPTGFITCPAIDIKIADTIGAGDAFTSGLIYKFMTLGKEKFFKDMHDNLIFASKVAAVICTGHGATSALRGISQVKAVKTHTI